MASVASNGKDDPEPPVGDPIFEPLHFRNLTVKNRLFRSNISGRFDNYDGSGNPVRFNWEEKFAKGGIGTIISSFVPVSPEGRIVPNYATIDRDERIPFWRELGKRVHEHDCRFIMQLSHSGRQRDITGVRNAEQPVLHRRSGRGARPARQAAHGRADRRSRPEVRPGSAPGARGGAGRRRDALGATATCSRSSSARPSTTAPTSTAGRSPTARGSCSRSSAPSAPRSATTSTSRSKISAVDNDNAVFPWEKKGTTIEDSVQVARWLEDAGIDAIHVSLGNAFPHPQNPAGEFPIDVAAKVYNQILPGGGRHRAAQLARHADARAAKCLQARSGSGPARPLTRSRGSISR